MLYPKIHTIYKRDEKGKLLEGEFSNPLFEYLLDNEWYVTEKIDGTNIRIIIETKMSDFGMPGINITFGGRTEKAQLPAKLVSWLEAKFHTTEMMVLLGKQFPDGATLFGEGFGAGIQKGAAYGPEQKFILFDVNVAGWWLRPNVVESIATDLDIEHVPVYATMKLRDIITVVKNNRLRSHLGNLAEGVVARPVVPLCDRQGNPVLVKVKTRDWMPESDPVLFPLRHEKPIRFDPPRENPAGWNYGGGDCV